MCFIIYTPLDILYKRCSQHYSVFMKKNLHSSYRGVMEFTQRNPVLGTVFHTRYVKSCVFPWYFFPLNSVFLESSNKTDGISSLDCLKLIYYYRTEKFASFNKKKFSAILLLSFAKIMNNIFMIIFKILLYSIVLIYFSWRNH